MTEPTQEQPAVTPTVSTAPARSRWRVSRIPAHLGRARTSTVVLVVLFLAIGSLYLNIRPDTTGPATSGSVNQVPASTTAPAPEPTETTPAPETTQEQPSTETSSTTGETTPTTAPTETTLPEQTPGSTGSTAPSTSVPPIPTSVTPNG